ncbi:hypothetical protein MKX03_015229 [Papaver bracteatum]|nr:hypothetical protein MKX03_015229 [Papaver bracteatum]
MNFEKDVKSMHVVQNLVLLIIQNSLITFYSDFGDVLLARRAFDDMSSPSIEEALEVFRSIDCSPNSMTLVTIISAWSVLRVVNLWKSVHCYSIRNLVGNDNIWVENALLNLYSECTCIVTPRNLFESMRSRDIISWATMISGYARVIFYEDAIIGSSSLGQWVHLYMEGQCDLMMGGFSHLWNALLDTYVKFCNMKMAIKVFKSLRCMDLFSWTIMINGMAKNGRGKQVMELFSFMLINGFRPENVTFHRLLILGRFVKDGFFFFKAMKDIYKIIPDMQHYDCIVDMYGRS